MRIDESGTVQSVRARLLTAAAASASDPNALLTRYGIERYLYRLSRSPDRDRFVLKGAMLVSAWLGEEARATKDADLLGHGDLTLETVARIAREACGVDCPEDGTSFDPKSVEVAAIRAGQAYGGFRVTLSGRLGRAMLKVQVDIGIGDATVPRPTRFELPSLLGLPRPSLKAYRPETVIAEKLHAMVQMGRLTSRLKDLWDVSALSDHLPFDGPDLLAAIVATFARRGTSLPEGLPAALEDEFVTDPEKVAQWNAFLRRIRTRPEGNELDATAAAARAFAGPVLAAAGAGQPWNRSWHPGGPWAQKVS